MPRSNIYVGLEIGTSKICVAVGEAKNDGSVKILSVGETPARGVRKGEIVDFETAQICVHEALERAEDLSDVQIRSVYLSVSGSHIESLNNRGCILIPDDQNEITEDDLEEVKEIAADVAIPRDNVFLHRIVQYYYIDGQDRVLNPVGMLGRKLEADYHIIHGIRTRIQNTIRCVREIPLEVEDVVFSPLASAQVVLNKENKERGALVIDIGGGKTDYVLYSSGSVVQSGSIAIGGDHITNDISIVLKVPLSKAKELKKQEGNVAASFYSPSSNKIYLEDDKGFVGREIDRKLLNTIIRFRMTEVFEILKKKIGDGYVDRIGSGIFLTGGCSLLNGIEHLAKEIFGNLPVSRSRGEAMSGVTDTFENPQYATSIGLIRYAQIVDEERPSRSLLNKVGKRFISLFSS